MVLMMSHFHGPACKFMFQHLHNCIMKAWQLYTYIAIGTEHYVLLVMPILGNKSVESNQQKKKISMDNILKDVLKTCCKDQCLNNFSLQSVSEQRKRVWSKLFSDCKIYQCHDRAGRVRTKSS
jgi:hypothetical protein